LTVHVVYAQVDELYSVLVSQFQLFVAFRALLALNPEAPIFLFITCQKFR